MRRRRLAPLAAAALLLAPALAAGQAGPPPGHSPLPPARPVSAAPEGILALPLAAVATDPAAETRGLSFAPAAGPLLRPLAEDGPEDAVETPAAAAETPAPEFAFAAPAGPIVTPAPDRQPAAAPGQATGPVPSEAAEPTFAPPAGPILVPSPQPAPGAGPDAAQPQTTLPPTTSPGILALPAVPPDLLPAGPVTPAAAARLFEHACLATMPEFIGARILFYHLGFVGSPTMRIMNHPVKTLSALATTPADLDAGGTHSCAILVDGLAQPSAAGAVAPIVAARFGAAERFDTPAGGLEHVVWLVDTPSGPARIVVTESGGDVFIGVTMLSQVGAAVTTGGDG